MITVITITFNNFEELIRTLGSIKGLALESVVINGGSCKKTAQYLKEYSGTSITEPDFGISDAFNKGVLNSNGDAIVFLNSGDILTDTQYLKEADEILYHHPEIDFVYADITLNDTFAGPLVVKSEGSLPKVPYQHPTLVMRKGTFSQFGCFDLKFKSAMDLDLMYWMHKAGLKGVYLQRPVVEMDGNGISSKDYGLFIKEKIQVIFKHKDFRVMSVLTILRLLLSFVIREMLLALGLGKVIGSFRRWKNK